MMLSEVVQQPNGLFALFSPHVDDFVHLNCTDQEMFEALSQDGFNNSDAWSKIVQAKLNCTHADLTVALEPLARWVSCMFTIRKTRGEKRVEEILKCLQEKPDG
jgi:hypothetical protein